MAHYNLYLLIMQLDSRTRISVDVDEVTLKKLNAITVNRQLDGVVKRL